MPALCGRGRAHDLLYSDATRETTTAARAFRDSSALTLGDGVTENSLTKQRPLDPEALVHPREHELHLTCKMSKSVRFVVVASRSGSARSGARVCTHFTFNDRAMRQYGPRPVFCVAHASVARVSRAGWEEPAVLVTHLSNLIPYGRHSALYQFDGTHGTLDINNSEKII